MGFMSLVFMGIYLIIMMAGALNILIAAIIFLVRFIKKKRNKRVGSISKVLAILLLSLGILAELPMVAAEIHMFVEEIREKQEYENLENKVLIETNGLQDEFEYNGEKLVIVEELENDSWAGYDEEEASFIANLVFNDSDETHEYEEMRKTTNNSGYDIYVMSSHGMYYVRAEDKEKVIDYYNTKAEFIAEVRNVYPGESAGDWVDCEIDNIDIQRMRDIDADSRTKKEEKRLVSEENSRYQLEVNSADYIWGDTYSFSFFDDCVLLYPEKTDDEKIIEGYLLSEEDAAYIREFFGRRYQTQNDDEKTE